MISVNLLFGGIAYAATLIGCYDGDTCKIRFENTNPIVAVQSLRLHGFDTPEIRGRCERERVLARDAQRYTLAYMRHVDTIRVINTNDKYGRVVVEVDGLADKLVTLGLARYYDGKSKRQDWCGKD